MRCILVEADGLNPYVNQAVEATLLTMAADDTEILYLWRNDKTVVIGKNQNAYTECKVPVIEADGGFIARRISGGGAVYHDKGNLNFTFLSSRKNYSTSKNFEIFIRAIKALGLNATIDGRNDVTIDGRKFSGNAFYRGNTCFHHGTVMISADRNKLADYLNVPKVKLTAKGVQSVASRVVNLSELDSSITAEKVADTLGREFFGYYGGTAERLCPQDLDQKAFEKNIAFFSDEKWRMGDDIRYDASVVARFDWGTADIRFKMRGSVIEKARIYTDSLDPSVAEQKEKLLAGVDIYKGKVGVNDIIDLIKEQKNGF